ncbi:YbaB/EbfC family nucleoid-associated protein [Actinomadura sp. 9N407]|uniref:YbaB/EbfC family nucleoid-associated protein n=1 Tax=Actinomadura sp. 9N407 TaxID=3375154 RepID=UPI0037B45639
MDVSEMLRLSQERMEKLAAVREQIAGLSGRAESADGRVKVACTAEDPLAELTVDPRAMRMAADDLAETVRTTARLARQDLDDQVSEITAREYAEAGNPMDMLKDQDGLKKSLGDMQNMFQKAGRDAENMMEQLQRNLGMRPDPKR